MVYNKRNKGYNRHKHIQLWVPFYLNVRSIMNNRIKERIDAI